MLSLQKMPGLLRVAAASLALAAYAMLAGCERETSAPDLSALATGAMKTFDAAEQPQPLPDDLQFEGADGPVTLADYRGKVVLVNLWAEWCAPCIEEMPTLQALDKDLGGESFQVLPVSVDGNGISESQKVLARFGAGDLKTIGDPDMTLMTRLGLTGLPASVLLDRQGREIGRLVGPAEWDSDEAKALIRAAIEGV